MGSPDGTRSVLGETQTAFAPLMETGNVVVCEESSGFRLYSVFGLTVALGGGSVILLVAVAAHDSASLPLIVIGGGWVLTGWLGWQRRGRSATRIVLDDGIVTFLGAKVRREIPARELAAFRWQRLDPSHVGSSVFTTLEGDTIRCSPRMTGLLSLLVEPKAQNPGLATPM